MSRRFHWRRIAANLATSAYILLLLYALFNDNARCRENLPDIYGDPAFTDNTEVGRCRVRWQELGVVHLNLSAEHLDVQTLQAENTAVQSGGRWSPSDCRPWQNVAIIIPYRDRWQHLLLLLRRLHPMLQKQRVQYRIVVVEQSGTEKFNRGRLLNIGVVESLRLDNFDCFIFHDVDLVPENDGNIYYCDSQARHLASAIDEMRYHVMYYNYAGGVIALNKENIFKVNGYSNDYWGWGNEDDDFSARTMESGLLLTRPPAPVGRYKMVRHIKQWRADNGQDLFLTWRSRWKRDGLNSLGSKYKVVDTEVAPLYTMVTVDIGKPPLLPPIEENAPRESLLWFLKFFFP